MQNVLLLSAPQIPTQTRTSEWDMTMSVRLQKTTYKRLVKDITALYDHARNGEDCGARLSLGRWNRGRGEA